MQEELVSIIVPIYNVEKYLDSCLESISKQTYSNIEVIMVNDGSKDSSRMIAEKYQEKDKRFILVDKENGGLSSGRNYGMQYIKGTFVSFIDSDDFISPYYVQAFLNNFDNDTDIIIADYVLYNINNQKSYFHGKAIKNEEFSTNKEKKKLIEYLLCGQYPVMSVWKNMYRTGFLKDNGLQFVSERIVYAEDKLFHVEAYTKARKVKTISDIVFYHLVVSGSLSQSYRKNYFEMSKELHLRIIELLDRYYDHEFSCWYQRRIPSVIGSAMFNLCKCNCKEALHNMKKILADDMVINSYNQRYEKVGFMRYWILYKVGQMNSALLIVIFAKLMLASNPLYRMVQRKKEYNEFT